MFKKMFFFALVVIVIGCSKSSTEPSNDKKLYLSKVFDNNRALSTQYLYDNAFNLELVYHYGSLYGDEDTTEEFLYNSNGQLERKNNYEINENDEMELTSYSTYHYQDTKLTVIKFFWDDIEENRIQLEYTGDEITTMYNMEYPGFSNYSSYYSFVYDSNDNVTEVKGYDSDDELYREYSYEFDNKNNLLLNVNSLRLIWDDFVAGGVGSNNIVTTTSKYFDDEINQWEINIYNVNYTYNDDNYPSSLSWAERSYTLEYIEE